MKSVRIADKLTKEEARDAITLTIQRFNATFTYVQEDPRFHLYNERFLKVVHKLNDENYYLNAFQYFVSDDFMRLGAQGLTEFLLKLKLVSEKFGLYVAIPQNVKVIEDDAVQKFIENLTSSALRGIDRNIVELENVKEDLLKQANHIDLKKPVDQMTQLELCITKRKEYSDGIYQRPDLIQRQNGLLENGYYDEYNAIQAKLDAISQIPKDYPLIQFLTGSTDYSTVSTQIEKAVETVSNAQTKIRNMILDGSFPVWELDQIVVVERNKITDSKELQAVDEWLKKCKTDKKVKDILMTLVPIGLTLITFFIPGGASLLLLGIKAGAQVINAGFGVVTAVSDVKDGYIELVKANADIKLSKEQIDLLEAQGKDAAVFQFFVALVSAGFVVFDIKDAANAISLYNKADNIGSIARKRLQNCKVKTTLFEDLTEEQLIQLCNKLEQEPFDDIAKLPKDGVVQFLNCTRDSAVTKEVLKQSECTQETLKLYLQNVDKYNHTNYLYIYEKTGYWPDNIQIPSKGDFLTNEGKIDWNKWAPNGGQDGKVLIGEDFAPKKGSLIDRYGSENGNYVSPMLDGKPFTYEQRALPYIEDKRQYHKYEVQYDSIFDCIKCIKDEQTRNVLLNEYKTIAFSNNKSIFSSSKIAPAFNQKGGGIQYEFGFNIKTLIKIGYLKEI